MLLDLFHENRHRPPSLEALDEKHRPALKAMIRKLQAQQSKEYWQFVGQTAEKVKEWPAWMRHPV